MFVKRTSRRKIEQIRTTMHWEYDIPKINLQAIQQGFRYVTDEVFTPSQSRLITER